jgi:hypothetical protein
MHAEAPSMSPRNARIVANVVVIAAGGALALLALRQRGVRRAALRALPMVLGGAPPWQVAAFLLARAVGDRAPQQASLPLDGPERA